MQTRVNWKRWRRRTVLCGVCKSKQFCLQPSFKSAGYCAGRCCWWKRSLLTCMQCSVRPVMPLSSGQHQVFIRKNLSKSSSLYFKSAITSCVARCLHFTARYWVALPGNTCAVLVLDAKELGFVVRNWELFVSSSGCGSAGKSGSSSLHSWIQLLVVHFFGQDLRAIVDVIRFVALLRWCMSSILILLSPRIYSCRLSAAFHCVTSLKRSNSERKSCLNKGYVCVWENVSVCVWEIHGVCQGRQWLDVS